MDKTDYAGIEISAKELIVALRRDGKLKPWKSFPNTPQGHRAIVRYLARQGRLVQVCLESTPGSTAWTWRGPCTPRRGSR